MKIKRIKIKDYYQFKDLDLDLTYPPGHEKAGEPLEKICIIGQSGTGKTSLLRLIKWFVSLDREIGKNLELSLPAAPRSVEMDFQLFEQTFGIYNWSKEPYFRYDFPSGVDREDFFDRMTAYYDNVKTLLINFPTEILWGKNPPRPKTPDTLETIERIRSGETAPHIGHQMVIDFAVEKVERQWELIMAAIRAYRGEELLAQKKYADIALKNSGQTDKEKNEAMRKQEAAYKKWQAENPSPVDRLADQCLDPLLENFGLKVVRNINNESIRNLGFISLQDFNGEEVPYEFWSTGTRQLVQTVIPLFQLKPENAVILIDEPERSLYPDVQRTIVDSYVKLAPRSQFIFATHSPLIASAFEPWEIIELKFDRSRARVYQDVYYDGENHVDNYKYFPEYMRWDSILQRIFDLEEEGNDKRIAKLKELTEAEAQLGKLKRTGKLKTPEGKELIKRCFELNRLLGWRTKDDQL